MNIKKTIAVLTLLPCMDAFAQFNSLEEEFDCMLEPSMISDIGSAVPGVLDSVTVDRGQAVSRGQVIAKLESNVEEKAMQLKKFQANSTTSMNLYQLMSEFGDRTDKRNSVLASTSAISEQDLDQIRTDSKIAQLRLKQEKENKHLAKLEYAQAKAIVDRKTVLSPINGVVMERYKSVGEFVDENPIVRVAQLNPLHVQAILPVDLMGSLSLGQTASIALSVDDYQPAYEASISLLDRVADAPSSTFSVRLTLQNDELNIPAGVRCRLKFLSEKAPSTYIADKNDNTSVSQDLEQEDFASALPDNKDLKTVKNSELEERSIGNLNSPTKINKSDQQNPDLILIKTDSRELQEQSRLVCRKFGPFRSSVKLNDTMKEVQDYGLKTKLLSAQGKAQYMVLSTANKHRLADVSKLKAAGIEDMFLIGKGAHSGRLSFGLYRKLSAAQSRLDGLIEKGVDVEIIERSKASKYFEAHAENKVQKTWLVAIEENSEVPVGNCDI